MSKPTVALDAFGVLYANGNLVRAALHPYLASLGSPVSEVEAWAIYKRASLGQMTSAEFWAACQVDGDDDDYVALYELNDGIMEVLDELIEAGYPLCALTNDVSEWSVALRRRFDLERLIPTWVVSGDIRLRKPSPESYLALVERLGLPPQQIVFFDDKHENVEAAWGVGMQAYDYVDADSIRQPLLASLA
ncbi:MAG: HAD-IA family hydrolase [Propionibacteriaceae bacterium]|nr:HAD-IA family hydrolase [Propionibacteriaceae bacterium]